MKVFAVLFCLLTMSIFSACDLRSDTAKQEMEKFSGTPTPTISPVPTEAPPDPADVIQVDTSQSGTTINVDGFDKKKSAACTKFDTVVVNGQRSVVTIKGACRQLMINGDGNQVNLEAASGIVVNGSNNVVKYSKFVNGKRPVIQENADGNTVGKVAASKGTL